MDLTSPSILCFKSSFNLYFQRLISSAVLPNTIDGHEAHRRGTERFSLRFEKRKATRDERRRWPNGVIPYSISITDFSENHMRENIKPIKNISYQAYRYRSTPLYLELLNAELTIIETIGLEMSTNNSFFHPISL